MPENKEVRKLELCDIAPYLPFGLKINLSRLSYPKSKIDTDLTTSTLDKIGSYMYDIKPYLRPITDLIKPVTHEGKTFVPMHIIKNGGTDLNEYRFLDWKGYSAIDNEEHETTYDPYSMSFNQFYRGDSRMCTKQYEKFQLLLKWHFDIFSLIPSGLAIPIHNTK